MAGKRAIAARVAAAIASCGGNRHYPAAVRVFLGGPVYPGDADLVIIDRNLFEIPASEISEATVIETVFDGRTVYERTSN